MGSEAREVRRGEVYSFDLSRHGFEKDRPVLIVQNDRGNRFSPETIVVPFRDIKGGRLLPVHVPVPRGSGGLRKDSVADAGIIHTVRKADLGPYIGTLALEIMDRVDEALRVSVGL